MNPKDTPEYLTLRYAAIAFLEAEKRYEDALAKPSEWKNLENAGSRLDAARSVLWDVINDKEIKP